MIYLDANVIIRWIEGLPEMRAPIESRLLAAPSPIKLATSQLSLLECRCRPLREENRDLLALYDRFFAAAELTLVPVDLKVIEEATGLRALHHFKTPDATHLASAIVSQSTVILSGDRQFSRFTGISVEIILIVCTSSENPVAC